MIVCLCTGTSDRTVRRLVEEGATTVREIGQHTDGAGSHCGSCCCDLKRMLATPDAGSATPGGEPKLMVLRR